MLTTPIDRVDTPIGQLINIENNILECEILTGDGEHTLTLL